MKKKNRLLAPPTPSPTAAPTPTPQPDVLIEWEPRFLATLGDTGEMLITPLDPDGHPLAGEPVTITRLEPPGVAVEGVTGETGSLRCAIAHDVADAEVYRYAVRARGVERIVEIPVVGVRFVLEGNPITGGQYRGVAADGVSTLAVSVFYLIPQMVGAGALSSQKLAQMPPVPALSVTGSDAWLGEWTFSFPQGSLTDEPIFWADLLAKGGHTEVGVLMEQSLVGETYVKSFRTACRRKGIRIVAEAAIAQTAQDVSAAVRTLYEAKAQAVVHAGFGAVSVAVAV